jgi:tetratricopeptide (TPR) repeat protein
MYRKIAIMLVAILAGIGCVSSDPPQKALEPDQQTQEQLMVQDYISKGRSFEAQMSFSSALEQYELALAIDPENIAAARYKAQVRQTLYNRAQEYYEQGLLLDEQGKYSAAKDAYLKTLQNWPDHNQARERLLPAGITDNNTPYITHTLTFGESVSKLGLIYYGDLKTYPVIGKFNNLEDVTRVRVGKELKIPVIPGTSLSDLQQRQTDYLTSHKAEASGLEKLSEEQTETALTTTETLSPDPPVPYPSSPETSEPESPTPEKPASESPAPESLASETPPSHADVSDLSQAPSIDNDLTAVLETTVYGGKKPETTSVDSDLYDQAMVLFHQKKYEQAIPLFENLKNAAPENEHFKKFLFDSHFQLGLIQFESDQYLPAKASFESAMSYDASCPMCPDYIEKSEATFKEKHYNLGIHYFGKEQLEKAIFEWQQVADLDPGYKDVSSNLNKAQLLHERLESIKKGMAP